MQEGGPGGDGRDGGADRPSVDEARAICEEARRARSSPSPTSNAPGQIVIAGTKSAIERAIEVAKKRGVRRALPLRSRRRFTPR